MRPNSTDRAGFTLIELLAVIFILSILGYFLVVNLTDVEDAARERITRMRLEEIEFAVREYENEYGDYPTSVFGAGLGAPPNALNLGGEALVVALWRPGGDEMGFNAEVLVNSDEDRSQKQITSFGVKALFEISDEWENPIAYFHHRDYGRVDVYLTIDPETGEELESSAVAVKDAKTALYHQPRGVQLISAGPDGEFGTEDDLSNFAN